ncbi:S41 family peptidase [Catenulispora pinisilvae]|uniref:S41 family peptidase n=1 Tax=Catenulispora pinisilvae TaxID=2705253 RepID=UPI001890BE4C|nr:S41 family peptidase [Catenulispora pinisilvae]
MSQTSYLRFPHLSGDLLTFVAEDDVWLAELPAHEGSPVRATRFTSDWQPARHPRLSPDGARVAWARQRDGSPEVYTAPVDGGAATRLTYWADDRTDVLGWASADEVIVAGGRLPQRGDVRAHAFPVSGGVPELLPYGTLQALAVGGPEGAVMTRRGITHDAAWWKRYRGGRAGKLWVDAEGSGDFQRILREHEGNIDAPMWVGDRAAFLSDAGGVSELYSCRPDGSDLRQHTDEPSGYFARHAGSDGTRVVFMRGGRLWLLEELDGAARPLDVRLAGIRIGRAEYPVAASKNLGGFAADRTGRAAAVTVRGTIHWLTAKDGPARALAVTPGVRARQPVVLGETGYAAWVTDAGGEWSIEIGPVGGEAVGEGVGEGVGQSGGEGVGQGGSDRSGEGGGDGGEVGGGIRRILTGEVTRVAGLAASPDGAHLAVSAEDNRLLVIDVESGTARVVASGPHHAWGTLAEDPVFSPDSRWLAWAEGTGADGPRKIRLADVATLTPVDVTDGRFLDWSPAFTVDGKHLAFLSNRTYDPYYSDEVFDLFFVPGARPYLVPLSAEEPSPFAPSLRGRPIRDEAKSGVDDGDGADGGGPGAPRSRVDVEGIAGRVVPFPVPTGDYSSLRAAKGGVLWLESFKHGALGDSMSDPSNEVDKPRLRRYDFAKRDVLTLTDEAHAFCVSGDGSRVLVRDGGVLRLQPADARPDNGDREPLDLDRIRVTVDPVAERRQGLREAWLLQRDFFWRDDLGGVDWPGVWERYAPLAEVLASHDDLVDLLWEVHGELGTSHAYVRESGHAADPARCQGRLGADLERDADGRWRITRILPGDASVPQARSPFEAPGVGARVGDVVAAIDGRAVDSGLGPGPLLAGKAGKPTEVLLVRDAERGPEAAAERGSAPDTERGPGPDAAAASAPDIERGPEADAERGPAPDAAAASADRSRHVVIVPLEDDRLLRYQAWVADRRAYVRERSGGRLGYVHLPDQGSRGWAEFHRDLATQTAREGLIVDTRDNRGGNTSPLVAEQLLRRVAGWKLVRGKVPRTYPPSAVRGPLVSVCDEYSASDGDIINQYLKDRGVPIVGMRTWGGVVGIDARFRLLDGTLVTQPKYMNWFDSVGYGLENHGCDPTVEVEYTPADANAGRDPQLDAAVDLALAELAERPAATPPERPWM